MDARGWEQLSRGEMFGDAGYRSVRGATPDAGRSGRVLAVPAGAARPNRRLVPTRWPTVELA